MQYIYVRIHEVFDHFLEDLLGHLSAHQCLAHHHDVVVHRLVVHVVQVFVLQSGLSTCHVTSPIRSNQCPVHSIE